MLMIKWAIVVMCWLFSQLPSNISNRPLLAPLASFCTALKVRSVARFIISVTKQMIAPTLAVPGHPQRYSRYFRWELKSVLSLALSMAAVTNLLLLQRYHILAAAISNISGSLVNGLQADYVFTEMLNKVRKLSAVETVFLRQVRTFRWPHPLLLNHVANHVIFHVAFLFASRVAWIRLTNFVWWNLCFMNYSQTDQSLTHIADLTSNSLPETKQSGKRQ